MNDQDPSTVELSPTYYLDNFVTLMNDVYRRYQVILTDEEKGFREDFLALPVNAQCLFVRLISRKGPLFRVDKLRYAEIEDLPGALSCLKERDFIELNPRVEISRLLDLLTLEELRARFPLVPRSLRKPDFVTEAGARLQATISPDLLAEVPAEEVFGKEFPIIAVARAGVLEIFQLLYFGNQYQDLSEFVLSDLGVFQYEHYALDGEAAAFRTRQELEALQAAIRFRDTVRQAVQDHPEALVALSETACPAPTFRPAYRAWAKAINELARYWEREGVHDRALALYRSVDYPPSRERVARILYKEEAYEEALQQCDTILAVPWNEEEATFARRIRERCLKKLKRPVVSVPKPVLQEDRIPLDASTSATPMQVEYLALELLTQGRECQGFYVENWLFNAIFGLHFWDVVYAPAPDAFYHPFQRGPRDLYLPEFVEKRRDVLSAKLAQLGAGSGWHEQVLRTWREKFGRLNPFVFWNALSEPLLARALEVIPGQHFEWVFARMLKDLRNHCTGFPDLILFDANGGYELVEVKGPGDRLQDHQRRWLEFFAEKGIPARVVYLE